MSIGVDLKEKDSKRTHAFIIACKHGRLENVKALVESGKDYGYLLKNKRNNTGLHKAAKKGHLEILQYLHSKGIRMIIS